MRSRALSLVGVTVAVACGGSPGSPARTAAPPGTPTAPAESAPPAADDHDAPTPTARRGPADPKACLGDAEKRYRCEALPFADVSCDAWPTAGTVTCWQAAAQLRHGVGQWLYRCLEAIRAEPCSDEHAEAAGRCRDRALGFACPDDSVREWCDSVACGEQTAEAICDTGECPGIPKSICVRELSAARTEGNSGNARARIRSCYDVRALQDGKYDCAALAMSLCLNGEAFRLGTELESSPQMQRWRARVLNGDVAR